MIHIPAIIHRTTFNKKVIGNNVGKIKIKNTNMKK